MQEESEEKDSNNITNFRIRGFHSLILNRLLSRSPCKKVAVEQWKFAYRRTDLLFKSITWTTNGPFKLLEAEYVFNKAHNKIIITTSSGEPITRCDDILGVYCSEHSAPPFSHYNQKDQYNICICACVLFCCAVDKSSVSSVYVYDGKFSADNENIVIDDICFNKKLLNISPEFKVESLLNDTKNFCFWIHPLQPRIYTVIWLHYMKLGYNSAPFCEACTPVWTDSEWRHMSQCPEMPNQSIAPYFINTLLRDLSMDDIICLLRFAVSMDPENTFRRQSNIVHPKNQTKMQQYKNVFFRVCSEYREKHHQKMGGIISPVTSDMTYVGATNKKGTNDNIAEHQETNVYTICEVTYNEKRRHTQRSKIVQSESIDNIGGFADKEVYHQSPWWMDGCGVSHSKFMGDRFAVGSCNHKDVKYTHPQTINKNALQRISNNNVENAHIPVKLGNKTRRGYGARCGDIGKKNRQKWMDYIDWRNTYTNATPIDTLIVFVTQLKDLYNIK
eukprot:115904_1